MLKSEARVGMKVFFGTSNGERTLGEITKINPTRAKVKALEQRGNRKISNVGATWIVPYPMMEKAEKVQSVVNGKVVFSKGLSQTISIGTTFTAPYADSNSLWKVISKKAHDVWLCEIIPQPDLGEKYTDWVGTRKTFLTSEIVLSLEMKELFSNSKELENNFYENLTLGSVIHYCNGPNSWVRCEVVEENKTKVLLPFALVGKWNSWDLPRRNQDGSICNGYHIDCILNKTTFTPNSNNIWENVNYPNRSLIEDPTTLSPINFDLPPLSPEEAKLASQWKKLFDIKDLINQHKNPEELLNEIRLILNN